MPTRPRTAAIFAAIALAGPFAVATGQDEALPPTSMYDPRLGDLRRASVQWENRAGPTRKVVDQVVLVPDVPAFYEAIAAWDELEWFPILIDDAELATKFVRAFHPARIVRYPGRPKAIEPRRAWQAAAMAVGRGWGRDLAGPPRPAPEPGEAAKSEGGRWQYPRADAAPKWLGRTPPGLVISSPTSPSLPGAVALAAGRFQPLVRWEPAVRSSVRLGDDDARKLTLELETVISDVTRQYALLGDDCDFVTLAAPYPDRYHATGVGMRAGLASFDDLVGRDRESNRRWAYTGRLTGDPIESVYRAMCSLFLQPTSGLLFDCYDPSDEAFRPYAMKLAAVRMPGELPMTVVAGPKSDVAGWHHTVDPINPFGLVFMNTSGGPSVFGTWGKVVATSADLPPTVPAAVLMIHSFSAAHPDDPTTLAGAWLNGGAFLEFGSLHEPYVQSFRTPNLVASLLSEGVPVSSAVRMGPDENSVFGGPWRLHLLGDPLYRIDLRAAKAPRWPAAGESADWTVYSYEEQPAAGAGEIEQLAWAAKTAILDAASGTPGLRPALEQALIALHRQYLPAPLRPVLDGLWIEALPRSKDHADEILKLLISIPGAERSPRVSRTIVSATAARFRRAVEDKDFDRALGFWQQLEEGNTIDTVRREMTKVMGMLAEQSNHAEAWSEKLKAAITAREKGGGVKYLRDELTRIEKASH